MIKLVSTYFKKTTLYKPERFIIEMVLIIFIISLSIRFVVELFLYFDINLWNNHKSKLYDLIINQPVVKVYFIFCLIFPLFETIILQALPITLISLITKNKIIQILASSIIFTFLHSYPIIGLFGIFLGGMIFSWSYISYRKRGCVAAILITSIIHGLSNFINLLFIFYKI